MSTFSMIAVRQYVRTLKARLRQRPDSEHEQAVLRIVIVATVFIYMAIAYAPAKDDASHTHLILLSTLAADLIFAFGVFVAICAMPAINVPRRIAGMIADAGTASIVTLITGEAGVSMIGVFLFITFGNGFRYGRRYLFGCQALCLTGFLAALLFTSYWRVHQVAGWSLFIALVVLPLYVSTLLTRIQEARSKAEEANRAKSTFLANMSHEMRTPLNGIVGVVDLLNLTRLDAQQGDLMRLLRHSIGVLRSLVDDVLDISKIEAGRLSIEVLPFDLHAMLNGLVRLLRPHAQAKGLRLHALVDPAIDYHVQGDPHHLRQVLLNLLTNAIKFTEQGEISVSVSLLQETQSGVRLRFEVRDTGIGMDVEAQARIFERFVQADESTTRRYGGTGLGTTIAKQLVELMSGTIGVTSRLGAGSTFWFEVPLTKSEPADTRETKVGMAAVLFADPVTANLVTPSIEAACGRVELVTTATAVVSHIKSLRNQGLRVPAVLVSGNVEVAGKVFETVAAECADIPTAMIYLTSGDHQAAEQRLALQDGVIRVDVESPPRFLRNAIHAAATQETESAQIIDLGQVLAEQRVSRRILVAEDNATNRAIIAQLLESAGHKLFLAEDGEEALDIYERETPDLAILDFNMPLRNGVDVTKAIRAMEATGEHLPVMMLSASVTPEARERAKRAGADEFLGKPYEATALLQAIDRLARRATRANARALETAPAAVVSALGVPLLDSKRLSEVEKIAGDGEFLNRLLNGFKEDVEGLLSRLDATVAEGKLMAVPDLTHAIKGAALGVGAAQLAVRCDPVEMAAASGHFARLKTLTAELRRSFDNTNIEFEAYTSRKYRVSL